jgi:NADP-dependent 3-hydroxy acid dehydrogenase YdfG
MKLEQLTISRQVVVVTGASSGFGRATARVLASRGARVVLMGRHEDVLRTTVRTIRAQRGSATHVVGDVTELADVELAAERAIEMFGHIDTWVNNAGTCVPGNVVDVTIAEARRMFDVSYWGMVYGSLVAVQHMRVRGGTIVNVGPAGRTGRAGSSEGHATASREAVKSFTDTLRAELSEERLPIHVTLVKPGAMTGGDPWRGRSPLLRMLALEPTSHAAELVAKAVLTSAERPVREVAVGSRGRVRTALASVVPRLQRRLFDAPLEEPRGRDRSLAMHSMLAAGNLLAFGVGMHLVDRARSRALDL